MDERGRRRLLSLLKMITGSVENPRGGMESAPVIKARICGRFIATTFGPPSLTRRPPR